MPVPGDENAGLSFNTKHQTNNLGGTMSTIHARTCHICEANCGILVEMDGRDVVSIKGNPDHILSGGYICPKATSIADTQSDPDRLRRPLKKVNDNWEKIDWETAFSEIAERVAVATAGPKIPALFLGNPNTHNYANVTQFRALANSLGTRGQYSAATLDQLPHMIMQRWVYGHNALYPVPDIDRTNYMLIVGGNPLASNGSMWTAPDVRGRIKKLQKRGGKLVVIDPRKTETAKLADAHHFVRPSTDTAFFLGLLLALDQADLVNPGRLASFLDDGWNAVWGSIRKFDLATLSAYCGICVETLGEIAGELGSGQPAIVYGRMGVSVQTFGTLNHWLIQLLNIATSNLDREGGLMFNLPAIDPVVRHGSGAYGRFTNRVSGRPEVLGELPAAELTQEITTPGDGQIGALFVIAGNPVISAPGGRQLDAALETLDLMVCIDSYVTETSRHADYILPPCGPLEKDHYPLLLAPLAVRNFACYSPASLPKEPGSKEDWEIMAGLAKAIAGEMGKPFPDPVEPRTALGMMLEDSAYDLSLEELEKHPNAIDLGPLQPQLPERLQTPDKKIICAPETCFNDLERFRATLSEPQRDSLTLIGRRHIRSNNSWLHNSHRLLKGPDRCTLMIHPNDADIRSLTDGDTAHVSNHIGDLKLTIEITEDIMPGVVSIPHGYGHSREGVKLSVAQEKPGVSINDLTDPSQIDPLSGNAVLNGTPVTVARA